MAMSARPGTGLGSMRQRLKSVAYSPASLHGKAMKFEKLDMYL